MKNHSRRITPFDFFGGGGVAKKSASAASQIVDQSRMADQEDRIQK